MNGLPNGPDQEPESSSDGGPGSRPTSGPKAGGGESVPTGATEWATVLKSLPNKMLQVRTDEGDVVDVHASGAMRVRIVRLLAGDRIRIQRSPFDPSKGRVTELAEGV
ncbi:MAG: hypothetical protein AAF196_15915 [Planctomycetota bacterium]